MKQRSPDPQGPKRVTHHGRTKEIVKKSPGRPTSRERRRRGDLSAETGSPWKANTSKRPGGNSDKGNRRADKEGDPRRAILKSSTGVPPASTAMEVDSTEELREDESTTFPRIGEPERAPQLAVTYLFYELQRTSPDQCRRSREPGDRCRPRRERRAGPARDRRRLVDRATTGSYQPCASSTTRSGRRSTTSSVKELRRPQS